MRAVRSGLGARQPSTAKFLTRDQVLHGGPARRPTTCLEAKRSDQNSCALGELRSPRIGSNTTSRLTTTMG
eukprot:1089953-Prorocentrum_lima.AAC.1